VRVITGMTGKIEVWIVFTSITTRQPQYLPR